MKRRISKRREKIIIARERAKLEKLFQFEPKDDFTAYNKRHYMKQAHDHWNTAAFLRPRETVKTVHSTN
jgi:hypothetical protein